MSSCLALEAQSSAALELLPVLLPGPKKSFNERRYLIDVGESTANLLAVVKDKTWANKQMRMSPFIVKIGISYFIAADGSVLLEVPVTNDGTRSSDALACLLAVFYVFNIKWCTHVLPSYLFLQCQVLEKKDTTCEDNRALRAFMRPFTELFKKQHEKPEEN